eukprot:CAMPEP_0197660906 /NCGR_PEP_ID=MMETSP1338-20131121/51134_1 /TAXON_ID=43686 ORGANISM="Pelagodinium beii, Strain RCC1491" /NCGR_SAMPLE_ID=MMETSP1338 /ASSEMBLY_ACC=CAM_ASM_000754 /LENGTH=716 /DNA_ID=CAMNT_0043238359 /DNA_START=53 /DNA_END=2203 /DNA_ORIENTATION=+
MQRLSLLLLALPCLALAADPESPINKVVTFIKELKDEVTADFTAENTSWDKYAKWADDTIKLAKEDIEKEEGIITKATQLIEENSGGQAASGAEIANAKKELKENAERTAEATEVFGKDKKEYEAAKKELEDSITALKGAKAELQKGKDKIAASKEASDKEQADKNKEARDNLKAHDDSAKKSLIQTSLKAIQFALRKVLSLPLVNEKVSTEDLQALSSLAKSGSQKQGFLQVDGPDINGDYQESSGAAFGIIETTLEDFEGDLKTANEDFAAKDASFKKLSDELAKEKSELEKFLGEQKANNGNSAKTLAENKEKKTQTQEALDADTLLLTTTEDNLKEKKHQYDNRVKLRLQELAGIDQGIAILTSDSAKKTFEESAKVNFLQLAAGRSELTEEQASARSQAYQALKAVSSEYHDLKIARLAVKVKSTGHFDKVIDRIDRQISRLRDEEEEDVEHRDRCQEQQANNEAEIATLTDSIAKANTKVTRLGEEEKEMKSDLTELRGEIEANEKDMADAEKERNEERTAHLTALKHDKEALSLLEDAIVSIKAFYKENKIAVLQYESKGTAPDKTAPELGFDSKNYEGGKDSTKGLLGMMDMVKEDMEAEIKQGKADDKKNQELFEKDRMAMKDLLTKQKDKELASVKALAEKQDEISDKEDFKADQDNSLKSANSEKKNLVSDCAWVKDKFESRRKKRKAEIEGLTEAKGLLAGASA